MALSAAFCGAELSFCKACNIVSDKPEKQQP
jgi:hypothetical protein